ncbi:glycerophosphodiester phosphodiesterase [Ammoniphilus oxalaticus]|uniref:Glycerophosphodiester phosphodiesterase n=1 Tax=Ammoniphilus oxalaticus TaxID=66863 RepID=A0A419SGP1_9BACL|nr:glycerophosphodiester phosphodiesterase family protein [Ammoniphilus oxalaticus]RKD22964.1 glycerophosphodiester phosphodiesterase [Ammoniphilus oxalaticus]
MNLCMAHRGWSSRAPENTMAAFELAFKQPEVEAIELDVQVTKDGELVVIHDFTVDRTTNGTGRVADFRYTELAQLDAGRWFDTAFAGERIPRLSEVLQAARGRCKINVELKTAGDRYPNIERLTLEEVYWVGMEHDVCLTSFDHHVIKKVRRYDQRIVTGLIFSGLPLLVKEQLKEAGASVVSMDYQYLTRPFIEALERHQFGIIAWTVNEAASIQQLMGMSSTIQICVNDPQLVIEQWKQG